MISSSHYPRLARMAVRLAATWLERKGYHGEAARLRVMTDRYALDACSLLVANAEMVKSAPVLKVTRDLRKFVAATCLQTEILDRKRKAS